MLITQARDTMSVKEAVAGRIGEICAERGMKFNELAVISGVKPSTVSVGLMKGSPAVTI